MTDLFCARCQTTYDQADLLLGPRLVICSECLSFLNDAAEPPESDLWFTTEPFTQCQFCLPMLDWFLQMKVADRVVPALQRGWRMLRVQNFAICDGCLNTCNQESDARKSFCKNMSPECGPEKCCEADCDSLRIALANRCIRHQYMWGRRNVRRSLHSPPDPKIWRVTLPMLFFVDGRSGGSHCRGVASEQRWF